MADRDPVAADDRKRWDVLQRGGGDQHRKSDGHHGPRSPEQNTQTELSVPFRGHIAGGMQLGKKIIVVGAVDPRPDRFYIGLTCGCGTSRAPPSDVALEIGVRFRDRQVLRRARVSGTWGEIERGVPFFPFIRDQPFKIEICCERSRFRVLVDGQQLFDFYHRVTSLKDIDTLWINGSVSIAKLG
ncbi:galectin-related protein-like [Myripristis murdjan]|uniref:Galectin n=1 Tax=Myripristis murdjan TaxID=586833 RepID=A0A667XXZ3_9TELE|nr:galectin-related protein-like [Myripristis murdjan]